MLFLIIFWLLHRFCSLHAQASTLPWLALQQSISNTKFTGCHQLTSLVNHICMADKSWAGKSLFIILSYFPKGSILTVCNKSLCETEIAQESSTELSRMNTGSFRWDFPTQAAHQDQSNLVTRCQHGSGLGVCDSMSYVNPPK